MRFRGSRPSGAAWQQPGGMMARARLWLAQVGINLTTSRVSQKRVCSPVFFPSPRIPNAKLPPSAPPQLQPVPAEPLPIFLRLILSTAPTVYLSPVRFDTHSSVSFPLLGHRHFHPALPLQRRETSLILTAAAMLEARLEQASVLKKVSPLFSSSGAALNANSPPPGGRCDQGPRAGLQL